jgi:hypothetical protein
MSPVRIAEAAEIVLSEATEPMHARDIASAIQARNLFAFRTADVVSVVSKALRKSPKFTKTASGIFALSK